MKPTKFYLGFPPAAIRRRAQRDRVRDRRDPARRLREDPRDVPPGGAGRAALLRPARRASIRSSAPLVDDIRAALRAADERALLEALDALERRLAALPPSSVTRLAANGIEELRDGRLARRLLAAGDVAAHRRDRGRAVREPARCGRPAHGGEHDRRSGRALDGRREGAAGIAGRAGRPARGRRHPAARPGGSVTTRRAGAQHHPERPRGARVSVVVARRAALIRRRHDHAAEGGRRVPARLPVGHRATARTPSRARRPAGDGQTLATSRARSSRGCRDSSIRSSASRSRASSGSSTSGEALRAGTSATT